MPLADYLAANYLSADPQPAKKRKRKSAKPSPADQESLTIADDGANDWGDGQKASSSDEDAPAVFGSAPLAGGLNTLKPGKKPKWTTIGSAAPKDADQAAADALLADAQAEANARAAEDGDDDAPAVDDDAGGPTMGSGAAAGLQSAAQVTAALRRKEKAELQAIRDAGLDPAGKAQETIYRDASGRVINVAMKRAELRAKAEEEERKRVAEEEGRRGDVQRREKEERREALREVRSEGVARGADDVKMNEELRGRERWNDPMAQLLASKKEKAGGKGKGGKGKGGGRTYPGASEPNRYGIRPGWRWDGVDRSNGFEKKWFAARNAAQNRKDLEYAWTMDE